MTTVKLLGIDWLTENLKDEQGNQHFTHEEALRLAKEQGVRLPTKEEIDALCDLPSVWDNELKGHWFAKNKGNLKNPERSLFLPAAGYHNYSDASVDDVGSNGYYWSSTSAYCKSYHLRLSCRAYPAGYTYRASGFSVRCVAD